MIIAVDCDNGIGPKFNYPWTSAYKRESRFVKELIRGSIHKLAQFSNEPKTRQIDPSKKNALIMGRRLADVLPLPKGQPGQLMVVITSVDKYREADGFLSYGSLDNALQSLGKMPNIGRILVIGGSKMCDTAIRSKLCREIFFTGTKEYRFVGRAKEDVHLNNTADPRGWNTVCEAPGDDDRIITHYVYRNYMETRYLELGRQILSTRMRGNVFGEVLKFDINEDTPGSCIYTVPILTTNPVPTEGVIEELLFFLICQTNSSVLKGIKTWEPNDDIIGIDQLANAINLLISDPHSGCNVITLNNIITRNPDTPNEGMLYLCRSVVIQLYVTNENIMLQTYQGSVDYFLGLPSIIMLYSVMLCIITKLINTRLASEGKDTRYKTGMVSIVMGEVYISSETVKAVQLQQKRSDKTYPFPQIIIDKNIESVEQLSELTSSDIRVINYLHHPAIKADMVA